MTALERLPAIAPIGKADHAELVRVARLVADRLLAHRWKLWFWGDSIGLEGLLDAFEITGDARYFGYVHGILKAWTSRKIGSDEWEYTAAGVALIRVYEKTGDPALLEHAIDFAQYLADFRKAKSGITIRYEKAAFDLPPELPGNHPDAQPAAASREEPCAFVDTMHFDAPFFSALYRTTGEEKYAQWALEEITRQIELLQDPATGLFHHFWIERTSKPNGVFWGRGNGWALLGLEHTLTNLRSTSLDCTPLTNALTAQVLTLAELQDPSGHWHTVLDDSESYLETSVAAFVVDGFSLAIREHWLDAEAQTVVEKALHALLGFISPDGLVEGVSYETYPGTSGLHYRTMPTGAMVPWGQGPVLTALCSYLKTFCAVPNPEVVGSFKSDFSHQLNL